MSGLLQDVCYARRQLRRSPGFTAIAVMTLAFGIGATTAMFGVLNAVLLRPLPLPEPNRLVRIFSIEKGSMVGPSPLDVRDFENQSRSFEKFAVYDVWRKNASATSGSTEPEQLQVGLVPGEYFQVLGIKPLMGRVFKPEENHWGNQFEAIIGYNFWQSRFHGDRNILGKSLRINDEPYTIIGVMPGEVPDWLARTAHGNIELWTPFVPYVNGNNTVWRESERGSRGWPAIARLKPGVSLQQASADLERVANNLASQYPLDRGIGVRIQPLQEDRAGNLRPMVLLLMGAVVFILLIACSNVANLLLARNSGRTREIALRLAIGARTSTLLRQFTIENLMLGLLGGIFGGALAWWACATLARLQLAKLPQLATVTIDLRVLAFAFGISLLSTLVFGAIPTLRSLKVSPAEALKHTGRTNTGSKSWTHSGRLFVVSEMALAVMLLVGTGLLIQSLIRLQNQRTGFRTDHLLKTQLFLPPVGYPNKTSLTRFSDEYVSRVRQLPGVQDATISGASPPDDQWKQNFTIEGRPVSNLEDTPIAARNVVDPHYLRTLGMQIVQGRDFSDFDTETSVPVALVNQAFVKQFFPHEDPIGKQIRISAAQQVGPSLGDELFTIVGVTADTMNRGPALPPMPHLTTLFRQTPDLNVGFKNLIVRTSIDPLALANTIRQQLHTLDPNLPFAGVATMDELMQQQTAERRYTTGLLGLFALFGVLLAAIGVYGVSSYVVARQTNEIGVRMALGAQREDVLWMVLKRSIWMSLIGAAVGLVAAWILRRAIAQLVFGISPSDPATFLGATAVLVAVAAAACLVPARRAAKVDPILALRYE
jgi:putative ABC transport system permease protein